MLCEKGRVIMAHDSSAMPQPTPMDSTRSRPRRIRTSSGGVLRRPGMSSIRRGSQRRPSRKSTVVTTSTVSWVSPRSGAENQRKVRQVTTPAPLIIISAASRWYLACQAAPSAHSPPMIHMPTKYGETASGERVPPCGSFSCRLALTSSTQTAMIRKSCCCSRRVPASRVPQLPTRRSSTSTPENSAWPSKGLSQRSGT